MERSKLNMGISNEVITPATNITSKNGDLINFWDITLPVCDESLLK